MKKYNLGALTVKDAELFDTKEEIIIEALDRLQKYVVEADNAAKNMTLTLEERYNGVKHIGSAFSGLANFLVGVSIGSPFAVYRISPPTLSALASACVLGLEHEL